jgi:ribosomal protein S18 acetylase RimI-like enzyme
MATPAPIEVSLRDGQAVTIRPADPAEVELALDYQQELHASDGRFLLAQADEFERDAPKLAERLGKSRDDPRSLHLLAWAGGRVVGDVMFQGGSKRRVRHTGWLGIGVRPGWQGRGLGRTLMETLLSWAAAHPEIERVQLRVYCDNARAVALYRSFGFVEECRSLHAFKVEDGSYADEFVMYLYVKPGVAPEGFGVYGPVRRDQQ